MVGVIVTIGDLLLDVIVRLGQPLAEGADADAITQLGPAPCRARHSIKGLDLSEEGSCIRSEPPP